MIKRILLVNPPYPFEETPSPPFGLMSLAAWLIECGYTVRIEDYVVTPFSAERARAVCEDFKPDVIGATAVTMNVKKALSILDCFAALAPAVPRLMGGPHVTFDAENILRDHPYVDYIVRGEGEMTTRELLEVLNTDGDLSAVKGISYRNGGTIIHAETRPFIEDINILPFPARHLIQIGKYRAAGLQISMITSRGCPHECVFCVGHRMVGRRVRYFNVSRVVDEFAMLATMGFKQINIVDDLFTSHKRRCMEICDEIIRRGIKHPWTAFARVDTVSRELLDALKRAGCTTLCFGIESGNQGILDRVKKKTNLAMCRAAIDLCREAGIEPMASYILGLPGETAETIRETMDFSKSLCASYGFHILAPFPGTEVRENSAAFGISILTSDWDRYDANQSVCESIHVSGDEVNRIVADFNKGIENYLLGLETRYANHEKLSDYDELLVKGFRSALFAIKLMMNELIEQYPGMHTGDIPALATDLSRYLGERTDFSADYIAEEVRRLFELRCIAPTSRGAVTALAWQ